MKIAAAMLAYATAVNAACAPGQWNVADNDAMLCDQEQCGVQCLGNAQCVQSCMLARNPTYDTCAVDCAAAAAGCGLSQCFGSCLTGCNDNCVACTAPACGPSYASCLGVELGAQPTTCCPLKNDFESVMASAPAAPTYNATAVFEEVREAIDSSIISDMAFSMGDSRGEIFRYEKGSTTMETTMAIASATKWVSGVTVMRVVETGVLSLDDLASDHLDYWTKDPADNRSRITLRHLLSFVAGITGSTSCGPQLNFNECVENMYANSREGTEPGDAMAYNEVALMYAGAMASAASGTPMEDLFDNYIFNPLEMTSTTWNDANGRPLMGSGLTTNAIDYGKFLNAYFNGEIVSQDTRAQMERSSYPNAALTGVASLQGQYGLANWFQCIPALTGMREQCIIDDLHMSVGARGYYPSTDRRHDFWMQIATSDGAATASGFQLVVHPLAVKAVLDSRE